jgi:hypothetical protein
MESHLLTREDGEPGEQMPRSVMWAIRLIWAQVIVGVLLLVFRTQWSSLSVSPVALIVFVALVVGVFVLQIYLISTRRNWARWLFAVFAVWGVYRYVLLITQGFSGEWYGALTALPSTISFRRHSLSSFRADFERMV